MRAGQADRMFARGAPLCRFRPRACLCVIQHACATKTPSLGQLIAQQEFVSLKRWRGQRERASVRTRYHQQSNARYAFVKCPTLYNLPF